MEELFVLCLVGCVCALAVSLVRLWFMYNRYRGKLALLQNISSSPSSSGTSSGNVTESLNRARNSDVGPVIAFFHPYW